MRTQKKSRKENGFIQLATKLFLNKVKGTKEFFIQSRRERKMGCDMLRDEKKYQ